VRDSAVISAYVRRRQQIEEELLAEDALAPTGDLDRDARAKKKYVRFSGPLLLALSCFYRLEERIMKLKKNQERRVNRKNAKALKEGGPTLQLKRVMKSETTVGYVVFLDDVQNPEHYILASLWSLRPNGSYE